MFISYRWTSPDHIEWVKSLAFQLRGDGIDVKLDIWDLRPGQDTVQFMESMVANEEITKVLIMSDRGYAERANDRSGGVGLEAQIISQKVYESTRQEKFAAVLLELDNDGRPILPIFLQNRIYFDFTTDESQVGNYEEVVRWAFDKPLNQRPAIGKPPLFLQSGAKTSPSLLVTPTKLPHSRNQWDGNSAINLLESVQAQAQNLILELADNDDSSEAVYQAIQQSHVVREEVYGALRHLLRSNQDRAFTAINNFFEEIAGLWDFRPINQTYTKFDTDVLHYFFHDCFIGFLSIALREEMYKEISDFLSRPIYRPSRNGLTGETSYYSDLRPYLESLEFRKKKLQLNRYSLHADILMESHNNSIVSAADFAQADLILYIRGLIDPKFSWYPETSVYLSGKYGSLRIFSHAESIAFFKKFSPVLLNASLENIKTIISKNSGNTENSLRFSYSRLQLASLTNMEKLGTVS